MAMLSNKQKVQRLATQLGGRIKDRTFFCHPMTKKYFEDIVMALVKRYSSKNKVRVDITWDDEGKTAYTDHRYIVANANCYLMKELKRPQRFLALHGFIYHETAHLLYTDKNYKMMCLRKIIEDKVLYPAPDIECDALKQVLAAGNHTNAFAQIWNNIRNALEDGYIEYTFLDDYQAPRFSDGLNYMRQLFLKSFEPFDEMVKKEEKEESKLYTILSLLLQYAKFGVLPYKNRKEQTDERMQAVIKCIPYIDDVNMLGENEDHYRSINNVVACLQNYLVAYLNSLPDEEEAQNDPQGAGAGCGANGVPQELTQKLQEMAQQAGLSDCDENNPSSNANGDEGSKYDPSGQPLAGLSNRNGDGHKPLPSQQGQMGAGGQPEENRSEEATLEQAAQTMQQLLNGISSAKAEGELEKQLHQELKAEQQSFDYGEIHNGVTCTMKRQTQVPDYAIKEYENVRSDIERLSKATSKGLRQILKDRRAGSVQRGLYFGKSISPVSYSRYDKKYFQNKKLPTDSPTLSIAVVIDESGSMGGRKIEAAKIMALVVYNFCMELGIRLMIVGHTASDGHVTLTSYCDFGGSFDNNDLARIMAIRSKYCNRDGYANKYAVEKLRKEQSDMKLCIVISDGAPNDSGYGGRKAYADIKKVKRDAKNHHIDTIVAAIDDDKEDIKEIYGEDSFLDITDLDTLPKQIVAVIKKYLPQY